LSPSARRRSPATEIKAETKGQIVEILVENGEPVEFGQPLFILKRS
jgi:biotin carboxyl carrier protein